MSTSGWSSSISLNTKASYIPSTEEAILNANDKTTNEIYLGYSIAIDSTGTRLVTGQIHGDPGGTANAGKVYVFVRSGTTWSQEAILSSTTKVTSGQFGYSVDIDSTGTRIIIGANQEAPGGITQGGKAFIYTRSGTTWSQEKILQASDMGNTYERFGHSVAIDETGTRAIVGARHGDVGGTADIGKVYVFLRSGTTWTQEAILNCPGGSTSWWFGHTIDIDGTGTRIVASALNGSYQGIGGSGVAFVFTRSGTSWSFEGSLGSDAPANTYYFGYSVSINSAGDYIAVSEPESAPGGTTDAGQVHIFKRTVTTWSRQAILIANDKVSGDLFGYGCSLSAAGDRIVIGSYNATISGVTNCGKAYIFSRSGVSWSQSGIVAISTRAQYDRCQTTAISGDGARVAYSSVGKDFASFTDAGAVGVFV